MLHIVSFNFLGLLHCRAFGEEVLSLYWCIVKRSTDFDSYCDYQNVYLNNIYAYLSNKVGLFELLYSTYSAEAARCSNSQ